jgi:hypothetical protein
MALVGADHAIVALQFSIPLDPSAIVAPRRPPSTCLPTAAPAHAKRTCDVQNATAAARGSQPVQMVTAMHSGLFERKRPERTGETGSSC